VSHGSLLLPTPRRLTSTGRLLPIDADSIAVVARIDPTLPREGYRLRVRVRGGRAEARVEAAADAGVKHATRTLAALTTPDRRAVEEVDVNDWPAFAWRGILEGFYGPPWSHEDRLCPLRLAAACKMSAYGYAPKNDPWHRDRWRLPYPDDELAQLGELAAVAREEHLEFIYAIAPGLDMALDDPDDRAGLTAKCRQVLATGIRQLAVLWDDIREGADAYDTGRRHGEVCQMLTEELVTPGRLPPLIVCPTDYAGLDPGPYRDGLASSLPVECVVWWTGPDVVSRSIGPTDAERARASYRRELLLWDNFPVNDFDPTRLFTGPLVQRDPGLADGPLLGILSNGQLPAVANVVPFATVADWAWNPADYDPAASWERAIATLCPRDLEPLVRACAPWPPSAGSAPATAHGTVVGTLGGDGIHPRAGPGRPGHARPSAGTLAGAPIALRSAEAASEDFIRESMVAHDLVGVAVLDRTQVELPLTGGVLGDVGEPDLVRRGGGELVPGPAFVVDAREQVVVDR